MRIKKPTNDLKFLKLFFESPDGSQEITFPLICKFIREKFQVTQVEMAKKLNVPLETYKGWEQGKRDPSSKGACNLCIMYLQAIHTKDTENQLDQIDIVTFFNNLSNFTKIKARIINPQNLCVDVSNP